VAGLPGGLAWAAIAPRAAVVVTGRGAADVVNPETPAFIAADGWFCVIGLAGGFLCGLAAYFAAVRSRGAAPAAGVIAGGLGASMVAWWVGRNIGLSAFHTDLMTSHTGTVLQGPLMLRAHSALVLWPIGTALTVLAAELLFGRRKRRPQQPASAGGTQWAEVSPQ
jgi:hypothetical protein